MIRILLNHRTAHIILSLLFSTILSLGMPKTLLADDNKGTIDEEAVLYNEEGNTNEFQSYREWKYGNDSQTKDTRTKGNEVFISVGYNAAWRLWTTAHGTNFDISFGHRWDSFALLGEFSLDLYAIEKDSVGWPYDEKKSVIMPVFSLLALLRFYINADNWDFWFQLGLGIALAPKAFFDSPILPAGKVGIGLTCRITDRLGIGAGINVGFPATIEASLHFRTSF
ncbi:MAG: hypothetical protein FWC40_03245 [Proteobacteria bacterium]|nr:hypothetical protein [Pseudomonadota bacterium]